MTWNDRTEYETSALEDREMRDAVMLTRPPDDDPWPTPADHQRARAEAELHAAEAELQRARAAWYETLPELADELRCSRCGAGDEVRDLIVNEEGYERWTSCEIADGVLLAVTDGWDDMSEGGALEYVRCDKCEQAHRVPATMEWA